MISQTLIEARRYEEIAEKLVPANERPIFHLSTRAGWMNDPNGFSRYRGEYHLFYQYYPYEPHWNTMHWGHAVTKDFIRWSYLPAALAPDTPPDQDGCFSGNAVTMPDGKQLLMYTGVVKAPSPEDPGRTTQTQCIAIGDGIDYVKYEGNPVLTEHDIPQGASRYDFRDPKLWREDDGTYRCIISSRAADKNGQVLLYDSPDGLHWKFRSVLVANDGRFGTMWECPDFFELDGKWVLLTSPMDMLPKGFEYHNGNGSLCLIGSYDRSAGRFTEEKDQAIDYGIDFYAAQTLLSEDGRRIMIAWMQNWDTCDLHMQKLSWCGQMTLPRELSIRNGRLYQWPVRELEAARTDEVSFENILVEGRKKLDGIEGRQVDLELEIRPADGAGYRRFSVRFAENEIYHTKVSYRPMEDTLKIDRKFSGSRRAVIHQRRAKVRPVDGVLYLRLVIDRYSVEVFVNHGEKVMTATYYTDTDAEDISFHADGRVLLTVRKWALRV